MDADALKKQYLDKIECELLKLVSTDIEMHREFIGDVERLRLFRKLEDGSVRDVRITWTGQPRTTLPPETYSLQYSWYRNADPIQNTDGRDWGDAARMLEDVKQWLVDLRPNWPELRK